MGEESREIKRGEIVIYKSSRGPEVDMRLHKEMIWLTQLQIALLFGVNRPAVTKHLNNIFKNGELKEQSVSSILEHTASDGKKYNTKFYNLDAVISVGYRVNSKKATQFRIWATKILKEHLIQGYTINERPLKEAQDKFNELQETISFLKNKSGHKLLLGQEQEILSLLTDYSKTLTLLEQYDKEKVSLINNGRGKFVLDYDEVLVIIAKVKSELTVKKEASELFGQDNQGKLQGIIKSIYQTFNKKELYASIEEKASHLLYFIIKDHPFVDGNKRIASFLFIYFLEKNNYLHKESGEKKINDNALVSLALLVAVSDRREKDKMTKIITNFLSIN